MASVILWGIADVPCNPLSLPTCPRRPKRVAASQAFCVGSEGIMLGARFPTLVAWVPTLRAMGMAVVCFGEGLWCGGCAFDCGEVFLEDCDAGKGHH